MKGFYFLKPDYQALGLLLEELKSQMKKLGKQQGIAVGQSTENMGHDDAVQEVIVQERELLIRKIDDANHLYNNAQIITPISGSDIIRLGSTVVLDTGERYTIGSFRVLADYPIQHISYRSPLAQQLIGKKAGDVAVLPKRTVRIISVT